MNQYTWTNARFCRRSFVTQRGASVGGLGRGEVGPAGVAIDRHLLGPSRRRDTVFAAEQQFSFGTENVTGVSAEIADHDEPVADRADRRLRLRSPGRP